MTRGQVFGTLDGKLAALTRQTSDPVTWFLRRLGEVSETDRVQYANAYVRAYLMEVRQ